MPILNCPAYTSISGMERIAVEPISWPNLTEKKKNDWTKDRTCNLNTSGTMHWTDLAGPALPFLLPFTSGKSKEANKLSKILQHKWAASWHPSWHSLIRVFAVHMKKAWVLSYPLSAQRRLWSDWADAQADLSLRWVHSHFVGFVMMWLNFFFFF